MEHDPGLLLVLSRQAFSDESAHQVSDLVQNNEAPHPVPQVSDTVVLLPEWATGKLSGVPF